MSVKPIPDGYHTVTPYLVVRGAVEALRFYQEAFGAKETTRLELPGGKLAHAEFKIGDSIVMMADENPDMGFLSPQSVGGTPVSHLLYVDDADSVFASTVAAGAKELRPLADQFYGDRMGTLQDPFGHVWSVATHVEDVTEEEMRRRFEGMSEHGGGE
jgi:PhnB protein